jgi:hypothetical protein
MMRISLALVWLIQLSGAGSGDPRTASVVHSVSGAASGDPRTAVGLVRRVSLRRSKLSADAHRRHYRRCQTVEHGTWLSRKRTKLSLGFWNSIRQIGNGY